MSIVSILDRYTSGEFTEHDEEEIFEFCHRIACKHLRFLDKYSNAQEAEKRSAQNISDEAISCTARLFCRDKDGGLPLLAQIWKSIKKKMHQSAGDAQDHLVNLIRAVVFQQRVENLRSLQPQEWKIRRVMRRYLSNDSSLKMFRKNGDLLVASANKNVSIRKAIPDELMREHCFSVFSGEDSLSDMLNKAIDFINQQNLVYNCVSFETLAKLITEYMATILSVHRSLMVSKEDESSEELEAVSRPVIKKITSKIEKTYLQQNKISSEIANMYVTALESFLKDLLYTGTTESQYSYLENLLPEIELKKFRKEHKMRFSYLVKELKLILEHTAKEYLKPATKSRLNSFKKLKKKFEQR